MLVILGLFIVGMLIVAALIDYLKDDIKKVSNSVWNSTIVEIFKNIFMIFIFIFIIYPFGLFSEFFRFIKRIINGHNY